jgi:6-phosphogluconolactonase (cycloisomerase 2 family)
VYTVADQQCDAGRIIQSLRRKDGWDVASRTTRKTLGDGFAHSTANGYPGKMGKYFMISLRHRFGLQMTSRALGMAQAFVLLGLMGLLAACGGGGGGGTPSGGGGGGGSTPVTLSSITVAPKGTGGATVVAGLTLQFTATGLYSDGTQKDLSSTVTWISSDTSKATISTAGLVTGVAAGPSTIAATLTSATAASVSGQDALTVAPPNLLSITVASKGTGVATVVAGLTLQFTATGVYSDSTQKDLSSMVTWTSSDKSKAIISISGLVTGVAAGPSTITATFTSATAASVAGQDALTVAPPNLLSVVISPNNPSVPVGRDLQFSAIGTYTDGTTKDLTASVAWTSDTLATATISGTTGLAKAVALGSTHIGGTMTGGPAITTVQMAVTATIYAYATNFDDDTVSQYQLGSDGSLIPLSMATVSTGHQPFSISVEPTGEYVYVSNWGSSSVSQYRIGSNGSLSPIGTGTVASGAGPNAVTIDHADRFAYVANLGGSTVSQFKIGLDGQLSPMSAPTVASGIAPASLTVDPTDHYAYVANFGANAQNPPAGPGTISQYSIGLDGSLTPMSSATVASGSGPNALAVDPASKHLYVANLGDNNVGQYNINSDGSLTAMTSPPIASGVRPVGITIDPSGKYVYVANQTSGTISQYTVGVAGDLTAIAGPPVTAGAGVSAVTIDPTGKFLYATNRGTTTVSQFTIGAGGALTPMTGSATVPSGLHPTAIATGY